MNKLLIFLFFLCCVFISCQKETVTCEYKIITDKTTTETIYDTVWKYTITKMGNGNLISPTDWYGYSSDSVYHYYGTWTIGDFSQYGGAIIDDSVYDYTYTRLWVDEANPGYFIGKNHKPKTYIYYSFDTIYITLEEMYYCGNNDNK